DHVHGLAAAHEPVDRRLRRFLARREAVVVIVVARVETLLHRRDRRRVDPRVLALVEGLALLEDLRRGERVRAGGEALPHAHARGGAGERVALGVFELGEPRHVREAIAHGPELLLVRERAARGDEGEARGVVGRTAEQALAGHDALQAARVDGRVARETGVRGHRDLHGRRLLARGPRHLHETRGLRAAGLLRERDLGRLGRAGGARGRGRAADRPPATEEEPADREREHERDGDERRLPDPLPAREHRWAISSHPVAALPITPIRRALAGPRVRVPASKSVANRELVLSATATGRSLIDVGGLDPGADVHAMADAIAALGHEVRWSGGRIEVTPRDAPYEHATIDAHDAGTVARFATALAATTGREVRVDGSPRMRERPMSALVAALRSLGATIDREALPLTVRGPLEGGEVTIPGYESSQFASVLLLVAPRMRRGLRLRLA